MRGRRGRREGTWGRSGGFLQAERNGAWKGRGAERLFLCWISFWFLRRGMTRRGWGEGSAETDEKRCPRVTGTWPGVGLPRTRRVSLAGARAVRCGARGKGPGREGPWWTFPSGCFVLWFRMRASGSEWGHGTASSRGGVRGPGPTGGRRGPPGHGHGHAGSGAALWPELWFCHVGPAAREEVVALEWACRAERT